MTFRTRLTLIAAAAVALAVAVASAAIFLIVRQQLRDEMDQALRRLARLVDVISDPAQFLVRLPDPEIGGARGFAEVVLAERPRPPVFDGVAPPGIIPDTDRDRAIAAGRAEATFRDEDVGGVHVRVYTAPVGRGLAVQIARSLEEVDDSLARVALGLGLVSAAGVLVAAALGWAVSRTALAPVRRMTDATEHVTRTQDLSRRIEVTGRDELGRLASSFNAMLDALEGALRSQRQLVADASHELRTPLTSLRTNIELLAGGRRIRAEERRRLLADVVTQLEELSLLVGDVVELARDGRRGQAFHHVRLDELVRAAVERAARRSPDVDFVWDVEPATVRGAADRLDRAVSNLLDNAAKWSPREGRVEVTVRDGQLTVRDHGPGIAAEDIPHVFDRFYRAPGARGMPGSGLGLAIVKQVAEAHGGTITAENAPDGGAILHLRLPGTPA